MWKTCSVHRKPERDRWSKEGIETLKSVPWRVNDEDDKADGKDLDEEIMLRKSDGEAIDDDERDAPQELLKMSLPRQFRISDTDYHEHGYTMECPGCKALLRGKAKQKHSDQCRARMAEAVAGSRRVEGARARKRKFIEGALKAEEAKRIMTKQKITDDTGPNQDKSKIEDRRCAEDAKTSRLEEIEDAAMRTDDIDELGKLYTEYMDEEAEREALKGSSEGGGDDAGKRARTEEKRGASASAEVPMGNLETNQEDEFDLGEFDPEQFMGQQLDSEKVAEARKEEIKYMDELGMFEPSTREERIEKTGKPRSPRSGLT